MAEEKKQVFSFMADDENNPKVITIKIPIARLVDAGYDGFCRMRGYMGSYGDQLQALFVKKQQEKEASGVITAPTTLTVH